MDYLHMTVTRPTKAGLEGILFYGSDDRPSVRLRLQSIDFNDEGATVQALVHFELSADEDSQIGRLHYSLNDIGLVEGVGGFGLKVYRENNPKDLPDFLESVVLDALKLECNRTILHSQPLSRRTVQVRRQIMLKWQDGAYHCDHDLWEDFSE